jgi:hypothetical protein
VECRHREYEQSREGSEEKEASLQSTNTFFGYLQTDLEPEPRASSQERGADRQREATSKKEERRGEQGRYCRSYLAFVGNTISAVSERLIRRASRTGRRYKRDFPGGRERPIQNREREREFKPLAVDVDTMTWRAWVDVD